MNRLSFLQPCAAMIILFIAAVAFRPLLPIDETRYMSVAWEMYLRQGWFQPLTVNFEPYHHKPPLLFWLINMSWSAFGVSRWAGLIPPALASLSCVFLTGILGRLLFPDVIKDNRRIILIMMGSVPFLIYSTLVLFDLTLTVFVLLALIGIILYSHNRRWFYPILIGLALGLAVLTKGPVAYLYTMPLMLLAPFWAKDFIRSWAWYGACLTALTVSALPVLLWLIPVMKQSDGDFAFWLIWNQTAGRITGNFNSAHARPFYFYLPLVPVLLMPWVFFPAFWRGARSIRKQLKTECGVKFLLCWLAPVFVSFCLISGKQPHYLMPLLPGIVILLALCLQQMRLRTLNLTFALMMMLVVGGQAVASQTVFKIYNLQPYVDYIRAHPGHDLAYVRNYQAEIGFLAQLDKPVSNRQPNEITAWFAEHPDGLALIRYKKPEDVAAYHMIMGGPYRGKNIGLFEKR